MGSPRALPSSSRLLRMRNARHVRTWEAAGFLLPSAVLGIDFVLSQVGRAQGRTWSPLRGGASTPESVYLIVIACLFVVQMFSGYCYLRRFSREAKEARSGVVCPRCGHLVSPARPADQDAVVRCTECDLEFGLREYARLYGRR